MLPEKTDDPNSSDSKPRYTWSDGSIHTEPEPVKQANPDPSIAPAPAGGKASWQDPANRYGSYPVVPASPPPPPPGSGSTQPWTPPPPVYASTPKLPTYTPPTSVAPITTVKATGANPIVAAQSGGVTIGGANVVENQNLDPAAQAKATLAANTTINTGDQDQIRRQQMDFLQMLHDSAYGTGGPSAAEMLYKKNAEDAINSQFGLASSVHGYAGGSAMRQAGFNAAKMQQQEALDSGILRAQEQQAARELLGRTQSATRDADQKLSIAQANLDQATAALNANLQTNVDMSNAAEVNKRNELKAQLDQATAFRNAAADEATRARQAELDLNNSQFNAGQTNATNQFNAGLEQQKDLFNTGQENETNKYNASNEQQRNLLDAQLKQQFGISLAELEQKNNQFNATQGQQNTQFFAGLQNQRDIAQLSATLQAMGYTNEQINAFLHAYMGESAQVSATDTARRQEDDKFFWDLVNVGASLRTGDGGSSTTGGHPTDYGVKGSSYGTVSTPVGD